MGTNVIHLADWAVPSYRRPRATSTQHAASPERNWSAQARQRAAQKRTAEPTAAQPALSLVSRTAASAALPASRPPVLRVTQLVDGHQAGHGPARLRISGRLVDVCAELDRLAAAEAAALVQAVLPRRA